jgi:hypothetical protein
MGRPIQICTHPVQFAQTSIGRVPKGYTLRAAKVIRRPVRRRRGGWNTEAAWLTVGLQPCPRVVDISVNGYPN